MKKRIAAWLPFVLAMLIGVAALWAESIDPRASSATDQIIIPIVLLYALVGALVVTREPHNAVGWLLSGFSLAMVVSFFTFRYAIAAYDGYGFGGGEIAASFGFLWVVALMLPVFLAHLLPTGRPLSPAWGRLLKGTVVMFIGVLIVFALGTPGASTSDGGPLIPNPLYVPAIGPLYQFLNDAYWIYIALFLGGAAALIVRTRRSRGTERQQLKWIVAGILSMIALGIASNIATTALSDVLFAVFLLPLPVSIGVAILRYRLYDIDVLIRRTLIYAAVSGILIAAYVGAVALFERVLAPVTEGNGVAVAISTLAVVALFQPVRRRIGAAVDRRFYRAKYDAERTLEAFSTRLRDEVDLGVLERELLTVVDETLQPARAGVWLRQGGH